MSDDEAFEDDDYCGCCGNEIEQLAPTPAVVRMWCEHCVGHVAKERGHPWDRTWFALYGTDCPMQVPALPVGVNNVLTHNS